MKSTLTARLPKTRVPKSAAPASTPTLTSAPELPQGIYFAAAMGTKMTYTPTPPEYSQWVRVVAYHEQPGSGNNLVTRLRAEKAEEPGPKEFRIKLLQNGSVGSSKVVIVGGMPPKGDLTLWHSFAQVHEIPDDKIPDENRRLILFSEQPQESPVDSTTAKALFDFMVARLT